jgi:hypothetical protein
MNDLDDLRDALHTPPGFVAGSLDLTTIMRDGGRLRRGRRLAAGSAAAVAGVALLVGGNQLIAHDNPSPRTGAAQAPASQVPARPVPDPTATGPTDDALGDVIRTGLPAKQGEWVLYATAISDPAIPGTTFGVMLGVRKPNGEVVESITTNETEGSDRAPGFHGLEGSMIVEAGKSPPFGYFVGKATRITVERAGSAPLTAHQAVWSEDPDVVIFWFDPEKVPEGAYLRNATAYDRGGDKLPAGHTSFGVG